MTTLALPFKLFIGDDLDAEAGQSLVVVHRRGQIADRGDTEIAQDLRADADLAPLPVAIGFGGFLFRQRRYRNAGRTVAQVNQYAATGILETFEHHLHALMASEDIPDDVRLVKPGQHVPAVADAVIDEGDMGDGIERRAIGIALQRPDRAFGGEGRDPLDQLFAGLAIGDYVGDGDMLELVSACEPRNLLALHHGAVVVHQFADDADRRQAA